MVGWRRRGTFWPGVGRAAGDRRARRHGVRVTGAPDSQSPPGRARGGARPPPPSRAFSPPDHQRRRRRRRRCKLSVVASPARRPLSFAGRRRQAGRQAPGQSTSRRVRDGAGPPRPAGRSGTPPGAPRSYTYRGASIQDPSAKVRRRGRRVKGRRAAWPKQGGLEPGREARGRGRRGSRRKRGRTERTPTPSPPPVVPAPRSPPPLAGPEARRRGRREHVDRRRVRPQIGQVEPVEVGPRQPVAPTVGAAAPPGREPEPTATVAAEVLVGLERPPLAPEGRPRAEAPPPPPPPPAAPAVAPRHAPEGPGPPPDGRGSRWRRGRRARRQRRGRPRGAAATRRAPRRRVLVEQGGVAHPVGQDAAGVVVPVALEPPLRRVRQRLDAHLPVLARDEVPIPTVVVEPPDLPLT